MSETAQEREFDTHSIVIERAVPEDAEAIMTLKREAWLATYVDEDQGITAEAVLEHFGGLATGIKNWQGGIAGEVEHTDRATFVAKMHGKVIGFTSPWTENGQRRLGALYVSPEAQGQGAGGKLLKQAVDWHGRGADIYLHVVRHNQNAIGFYEHEGFQKTGVEIPLDSDDEPDQGLLPEIEMVLKAAT